MVHRIFRSIGFAAVLIALQSTPAMADWVLLQNTVPGENGLLVDGLQGVTMENDKRFVSPSPNISIGSFGGRSIFFTSPGEVIAFATDRPPKLVPNVAWSAWTDTVTVPMDAPYGLDLAIWIVQGPADDQARLALEGALTANEIWSNERQGFEIVQVRLEDATRDPDAPAFRDFECTPKNQARLRTAIGYTPGTVNVYYVRSVYNEGLRSSGWGYFCYQDIILGANVPVNTLAHELAHSFDVHHSNNFAPYFDSTNVAWSGSKERRYLTEGQTFQAIISSNSSINSIYNLRPGQVTRECFRHTDDSDPDCPAMQTRIWADGPNFPPN